MLELVFVFIYCALLSYYFTNSVFFLKMWICPRSFPKQHSPHSLFNILELTNKPIPNAINYLRVTWGITCHHTGHTFCSWPSCSFSEVDYWKHVYWTGVDRLHTVLAQASNRWCHFLLMINITIMLCTHQNQTHTSQAHYGLLVCFGHCL